MPVDRHKSPPVTPYQVKRRRWLDYVSDLTARAAVEADEHTRQVWLPLSIALTAACPRRGHRLEEGQVEATAQALVREHIARCMSCHDSDWTWITKPLEEEA